MLRRIGKKKGRVHDLFFRCGFLWIFDFFIIPSFTLDARCKFLTFVPQFSSSSRSVCRFLMLIIRVPPTRRFFTDSAIVVLEMLMTWVFFVASLRRCFNFVSVVFCVVCCLFIMADIRSAR